MKKMNFTIKAILLCFVTNASGGSASIIGTWTCVTTYYKESGGVEYEDDFFTGRITTFYEDGRITGLLGGDGDTWSIIDDTLYITWSNGTRHTYKIQELTNAKLKIKRGNDESYCIYSYKK